MLELTDKIALLRTMLQHGGASCCPAEETNSDAWFTALLRQAGGDIEKAAYLGCIALSRETGIRLPDGTTLPNDAPYWLRMAKMYRPSASGVIPRADERDVHE